MMAKPRLIRPSGGASATFPSGKALCFYILYNDTFCAAFCQSKPGILDRKREGMRVPKQNRGPYILAAGAAAQLLTGIPAAWGRLSAAGHAGVRLFTRAGYAGVCGAGRGLRCGLCRGRPSAGRPRPAPGRAVGHSAAGRRFLRLRLCRLPTPRCFLLSTACPPGWAVFLAPAVLACAQKWYQDKKGWATGVAGVAMGAVRRVFTVFVKGIGGRWGIRVCFAALGAVMLVVCGAGALILQDPPPKPQSGAAAGRILTKADAAHTAV